MNGGFAPEAVPRSVRALLIANIAIFVLDYLTRGAYALEWLALDPGRVTHGLQLWRLVTYMFVHDAFSFWHVLINMLMLWMFGTPVAREMGERRFWTFYLLSGLFAGICSLLFHVATNNPTVVVGASGALFALMVAFARFFPTQHFLILFLFPVQAKYAVLIFAGIELLAITANDRIAHVAHLGGALFAWIWLRRGLDLDPVAAWRAQRTRRGLEKAHRAAESMRLAMSEIDPILEKISRLGIQSLTREEKEKLARASEMRRQGRGPVEA